jgi:hypothetical protein
MATASQGNCILVYACILRNFERERNAIPRHLIIAKIKEKTRFWSIAHAKAGTMLYKHKKLNEVSYMLIITISAGSFSIISGNYSTLFDS